MSTDLRRRRYIAFSPDGKLLAAVRPEPLPFVRVWTLDPERLLRIARHRVTRSLTADECRLPPTRLPERRLTTAARQRRPN